MQKNIKEKGNFPESGRQNHFNDTSTPTFRFRASKPFLGSGPC